MAENEESRKEAYRGELLELVPQAIALLKTALTREVTTAQMRAAELVLRGSGVIQDQRVIDEIKKLKGKNATDATEREVVFSHIAPRLKGSDGE